MPTKYTPAPVTRSELEDIIGLAVLNQIAICLRLPPVTARDAIKLREQWWAANHDDQPKAKVEPINITPGEMAYNLLVYNNKSELAAYLFGG